MNVSEFASKHNINFVYHADGPNKVDGKTPFKWKVTLIGKGNKTLEIPYTMGAAYVSYKGKPVPYHELHGMIRDSWGQGGFRKLYATPPELCGVLSCLHSDCTAVENTPLWEDYAAIFGYNEDSRKDYAVWETCCEQYRKVREFLGYPAFGEFLTCEPE